MHASTQNWKRAPEGIFNKWIDVLFVRFARIWPMAWPNIVASNDIDEIAHEWSEGLAGLDGEQIKRGIEQCRQRCKWPPSIAEFRQAAEGVDENLRHAGAAYRIHESSRLLKADPNEETKKTAVVSFEKMKGKLRR